MTGNARCAIILTKGGLPGTRQSACCWSPSGRRTLRESAGLGTILTPEKGIPEVAEY